MPVARPVIIDTDWWTDVDDVVSMRVAAACERAGLIDIRAITLSASFITAPGSLDAMMVQEGHPGIPIGRITNTHSPSGSPAYQNRMASEWDHTEAGGPSTLESAVTLMRRTLVAADDGSVDILSIGFTNNIADLLASAADGVSPLTGSQLVALKVRHLWVMGGEWPTGSEHNFNETSQAKAAASAICVGWPTPITFLGFEIGVNVLSGGTLRTAYPTDIVTEALADHGSAYGRNSWDPLLIRLAALGDPTLAGYTTVTGTASVNTSSGANSWVDSPTGPHRYVVMANPVSWYERDLADLIWPEAVADDPQPDLMVYRDGEWVAVDPRSRVPGGASVAKPSRATASVTDGLIMHLHVDDLSDTADGATFRDWPCRMRSLSVRAPSASAAPTRRASIGGLACAEFTSDDFMVSKYLTVPRDATMYARVRWASLPAGWQQIIAAEHPTGGERGIGIRKANTGEAHTSTFVSTGAKNSYSAALLATDTWYTIAGRILVDSDTPEVDVVLDGTFTTPTAMGGNANLIWAPFTIGQRTEANSTEHFIGYLRELRVYDRAHDDATITAITTEMS